MSDLTDRLRRWAIATDAVPASDLMDEAADEIDRLRLTDAEREVIEAILVDPDSAPANSAAILRGLLERTK